MPACLPEQLPRRAVGCSPSRRRRCAVSVSYGAWTWFWSTALVRPARRRISCTRRTCRSSPEWLAAMMASASVPSSYSSNRPDATNGASWNGFALERRKTNWSGSPVDCDELAIRARRPRPTPRWTDSTRSPRGDLDQRRRAGAAAAPTRAPSAARAASALLPAASLTGRLALALLRGEPGCALALALAEDAATAGARHQPGAGGCCAPVPGPVGVAAGRAPGSRVMVTPPSQWAPSLTTRTCVLMLPFTRPVEPISKRPPQSTSPS